MPQVLRCRHCGRFMRDRRLQQHEGECRGALAESVYAGEFPIVGRVAGSVVVTPKKRDALNRSVSGGRFDSNRRKH